MNDGYDYEPSLSKTPARPKRDYLKGLAYAIWGAAALVLVYGAAVLVVMFFYAASGHGGEADGGQHWYWSAVFIGAAWTLFGAAVLTTLGLIMSWATRYLEEH